MSKTRREFTLEFKREAAALLESGGKPLTQVAVELGIQPSILRAWRAVIRGGAPRSAVRPPGAMTASSGASPADLASQNAKLKRELDRTRMERDVLKKSHRHLRGDAEMRFSFIEQHIGTFPVRLMCRVLDVSPSGFYAWRSRPESMRAFGNRQFLADVQRLHEQPKPVFTQTGEDHLGASHGCSLVQIAADRGQRSCIA